MASRFVRKLRSEILWGIPHDALDVSHRAGIAPVRKEKSRTPRPKLQKRRPPWDLVLRRAGGLIASRRGLP